MEKEKLSRKFERDKLTLENEREDKMEEFRQTLVKLREDYEDNRDNLQTKLESDLKELEKKYQKE